MKKVINVTATDIKKGVQGDCHLCPIAIAVLRAFKSLRKRLTVSVFENATVYTPEGIKLFKAVLPEKAHTFILRFDMASGIGKFKPFKFTADFVKQPQ